MWARPEPTNYRIGESVRRALPAAISADHAHLEAARESGCSALGTSPKGTTVCCQASLPVASNPNTGAGVLAPR